jgi:HAD superfamily hydrolase (TIGR01490 family)
MPFLLLCYVSHRVGLMSVSVLHKEACHYFFYGKSINDLKLQVDSFLDSKLLTILNESVLKKLKDAKKEGHYTVLLSSSPDFLVGEIARRLEFHEWAGTEYSLTGNQQIGDVGLLMEGEQKAQYVRNLIQRMQIGRDKITAYTDSILDAPFLEAVGNPIVVNPDRQLLKLSRKRNWKIL